jgi:Zn-dependent peptidase ImmA (M78 family)/transcriptional regulator with XRE-family HTH domain
MTTHVPITPSVLRWAIDESGFDEQAVAAKVDVDPDTLAAWLVGSAQPTLTKFKRLAEVLKRPSATLLRSRPPEPRPASIEFRHPPEVADRDFTPEERLRLREAGRLQRGMSWVARELGDAAITMPRVEQSSDPERAASRLRTFLGISVEAQLAWTSPSEALRAWRAAFEAVGIAVLALPLGKDSSRGFSLWEEAAPVIAYNTHWNPVARIFTLGHELGHLVTRTNSMCAERATFAQRPIVDESERWCEAFSAALLLPWPDVQAFLVDKAGWTPGERIEHIRPASRVARAFKVSHRAVIIRLIHKGLAGWELYRQIPKSSEAKGGGGGGEGRRRPMVRIDEYGRRVTITLLRGVDQDLLSRHDALGYLNVADDELDELRALAAEA